MTSDGRLYGPVRYKEIQRECYIISKNSNTTYTDILHMTPLERKYWLEFISDEFREAREAMTKQNEKR